MIAPQRSETLTDTTLSFDWQPYRYLSLSTSLGKAINAQFVYLRSLPEAA